ncbi:MAG TPA: S8/S53 family peptidase [Ignavibacteriaceae bacterium]|nr:S8/S53 family peptidase [Ignavibacteriaceae bacterium]
MKKIFTAFFFMVIFSSAAPSQETNYVSGELIIQLKPGASLQNLKESFRSIDLTDIRLLSARMNIRLFEYNTGRISSEDVLFQIRQNKNVNIVQFNHYVHPRNGNSIQDTIPSDPMFNQQWALNNTGQTGGTPDADIDAPEAWGIATGGVTVLGDTIVVAIVDGGCDLNHQDLTYWHNYAEIPNNGIDDDGNGYIDDFRGWNAYNNNGNVPSDFHGTHVSGIAAAHGNNGLGVSGVNWYTQVMPVAASSGTEAIVVAGYAYVLEMRARYNESNGSEGAFIVSTNSSFGVDFGQPEDYPIWCAMYDSMGVQGILSCAATANLNINVDVSGDIPTACPSPWMISVTNTTNNDLKNSGAAYGLETIDLGAPGTSILSTVPGNSYSNLTGTSMATPHVAGAIALMYAGADLNLMNIYKNDPAAGALLFRDYLFAAVDTIPALEGITVTGGRLNIYNAVMEVSQTGTPVELASFEANTNKDEVLIKWSTATEINNKGFEIERSSLNSMTGIKSEFKKVGFVGGNGSTTENISYYFEDKILTPGIYYYRLKQIDLGGQIIYSREVEVEVKAPAEFSLSQNYPNPFNPSTTISFTLPEKSNIRINIFNVIGELVETLINNSFEAGYQSVKLDAKGLTSGVYFYTIEAKGESKTFTSSKKMLLIK